MPCLPFYRLLMAAALLMGTITLSRLGQTGPSDACRGVENAHPCANLAEPPAVPARQARGRGLVAFRTAS